MAGWNFLEGKSNNAVEADNNEDLLKGGDAVKWLKKNHKITISAEKLVEKCHYAERHHASKCFNWTYYFSLETLENFGKGHAGTNFSIGDGEGETITITYPVWGGSLSRPVHLGENTEKATKRGNWAILPDGTKKKLTGNGVKWEFAK